MAHCRKNMSSTKPEVHPHFVADNRLVQRLQSSVCPCHVLLHRPVQFTIIRGVIALSGTFSPNFPFPFGDRHSHVTQCSSGQATHHPKRHLDRFSRFCMGPKCYAAQSLSVGKDCPFPWDSVTLPAIGNMHKKFGSDRSCGSGDILADRHTHKHTDVLITILCHRSHRRSK